MGGTVCTLSVRLLAERLAQLSAVNHVPRGGAELAVLPHHLQSVLGEVVGRGRGAAVGLAPAGRAPNLPSS